MNNLHHHLSNMTWNNLICDMLSSIYYHSPTFYWKLDIHTDSEDFICFVTKVFSVSKLLSRFITCAAVDLFVLSESKSSLCNLWKPDPGDLKWESYCSGVSRHGNRDSELLEDTSLQKWRCPVQCPVSTQDTMFCHRSVSPSPGSPDVSRRESCQTVSTVETFLSDTSTVDLRFML